MGKKLKPSLGEGWAMDGQTIKYNGLFRRSGSIKDLLHDRFAISSLTNRHVESMSKVILASDNNYSTILSRPKFIDEFLKNWLTERQFKEGAWYRDMLETYTTEILLYAQKIGIEKLLLQVPSKEEVRIIKGSGGKKYPLAIVPKPTRMKVALEEIEGDLTSQTKLINISNIKPEVEQDNGHVATCSCEECMSK